LFYLALVGKKIGVVFFTERVKLFFYHGQIGVERFGDVVKFKIIHRSKLMFLLVRHGIC
jgi:hypothetical protein